MELIVAATDLTRRSAHVLGRTARLARLLGARVLLVHVIRPPRPGVAGLTRRALRRGARPAALRERLRAAAAPYADVDIECKVIEDAAEVALSSLMRETGAGLLVAGLHRERRVLDLLRLTTLERIVLSVEAPVLIAHRTPAEDYARVLGAVTFSPTCARALSVAARIAPGASMHAIHALQMPLREKLTATEAEVSRTMTEAEMLRTAFCTLPGVPDGLIPPEIVIGGVHEVLRFRMEELGPDLLAMGTHSGRDPGTLGNYTRDMMRAPPTDVLIVKPGPPG